MAGGFHPGSVVKNPLGNIGDVGSIPNPERSQVLWSTGTEPVPQCLGATAAESTRPRAVLCNARPPRPGARVLQLKTAHICHG